MDSVLFGRLATRHPRSFFCDRLINHHLTVWVGEGIFQGNLMLFLSTRKQIGERGVLWRSF